MNRYVVVLPHFVTCYDFYQKDQGNTRKRKATGPSTCIFLSFTVCVSSFQCPHVWFVTCNYKVKKTVVCGKVQTTCSLPTLCLN